MPKNTPSKKNVELNPKDLAWEMHQEGHSMKEIMEASGLSYSKAWLHITDLEMPEEYRLEAKGELIAAARLPHTEDGSIAIDPKGDSWGYIAVRCQKSEATIRRLFTEHTNLKSKGLRTGKGGRWAYGEREFYQGEHSQKGIAISASQKGRPPLPSEVEKLNAYSFKDLKALAAKAGVEVKGKVTKGALIQALLASRSA